VSQAIGFWWNSAWKAYLGIKRAWRTELKVFTDIVEGQIDCRIATKRYICMRLGCFPSPSAVLQI
jgi:hypothetical protein